MMRRLVQTGLVLLLAAIVATPAAAQVYTGRIDATVKDSTGAVLPGVTVDVTGPATQSAVTDARGEVHLLNLPPGRYSLTAKLQGFTDYKNENVTVSTGTSVGLEIAMAVGGVATQVEVLAETPVIDVKKQTVSTNVSVDELQNVPSSRDPWVVLQTVPGIIVDRVNVGGAESGQQSNYQAKGASGGENTWNMDGVAITDMAALGSSPTYYDFDMFQEMQVTTGGADPSNPTPGVHLNFVLKGGTNQWRGSGRVYFENNSMQSDNVDSDLVGQLASYNRVGEYKDYGAEGGGPIVPGRLFAWGAYGKTEPELKIFTFRSAQQAYVQTARDATILENFSAKVTGELNQKSRAIFAYFRGNKQKFGRGASATRPDETTYNQDGPTDLYKFEMNQTFGNSLFVSGRYARTLGGFSLEPRGGREGVQRYVDDDGVNHNTFGFYATDRPQDVVSVDGNAFKGRHELKFGFGWRRAAVTSESGWPGGLYSVHNGYPSMDVTVVRNWAAQGEGVYLSGYLGDTISLGRLTLNIGARWDRQSNLVSPASVPANPIAPDLLPALTATEQKDAIVWNSVTPRVGLTYALNESRRTIARASYAMFASQLNAVLAASTVSQIPYYSYVYYSAVDLNGNQVADPNELLEFQGVAGFNPDDPLNGNPDRIGDYKTPLTHELVFGVDHELVRNFGVSGSVTWRRFTGINYLTYRGVTANDYTLAGTLNGTNDAVGSFDVPFYTVNASAVPDDFGRVYTERPGYHQRFLGFELAATKRMSNNWMLRLGFSTNDHREYFDGPESFQNGDPTSTLANPHKDGGNVMTATTGSGKASIYMVLPSYQFITTAAYQGKWGINYGVNYNMRQGFATPYHRTRTPGSADDFAPSGKSVLLVEDVGENRLPTQHTFDGRISKNFQAKRLNLNIDLDVFNLFNTATELGRGYDLRLGNFNQVLEIVNPRIARVGVRVGF